MTPRRFTLLAVGLVLLAFGVAYRDVIAKLVHDWAADENYSHGFLIVPIAIYFAWERRARLAALSPAPAWSGLAVVLASLAVLGAGVLGAELFLARVSMLGVLAGTVLVLFGWQTLRVLSFPIAFLLLMIPIPAIVFNQVAFPLQLLASRFGEFALELAGVPVLREGNVITLATTTLEVAEACSGIRSLVSLLTLAIVYGYLAERRTWARVALALASVPVAIVANGLRVAGTGIAAQYVGPEAAEGFLHTFSGWLVFLVAFVLLFGVQKLLALARGRIARDHPPPAVRERRVTTDESTHRRTEEAGIEESGSRDGTQGRGLVVRALMVALCLALGAGLIARSSKSEVVPPRESLATFPMRIGPWEGESSDRFDQRVLTVLGVDEYIARSYAAPGRNLVGLYVGYYNSQRQGDTMHSPLNCLPGAGWEPVSHERITLPVDDATSGRGRHVPPVSNSLGDGGRESDGEVSRKDAASRTIVVNRVLIQKGLDRQVVVYWYQGHGRVVASEYWGKIYTVLDAIRLHRTDAAMVRVISPVEGSDAAALAAASGAATDFVRAVFPLLGRYLPD